MAHNLAERARGDPTSQVARIPAKTHSRMTCRHHLYSPGGSDLDRKSAELQHVGQWTNRRKAHSLDTMDLLSTTRARSCLGRTSKNTYTAGSTEVSTHCGRPCSCQCRLSPLSASGKIILCQGSGHPGSSPHLLVSFRSSNDAAHINYLLKWTCSARYGD